MIRDSILFLSLLFVGLCMYMTQFNLIWQIKFHVPRRIYYACAYFFIGVLIWEVGVFVILPAPLVVADWKSALYVGSLLGAIIGIAGIVVDQHKRTKRHKERERKGES